MYTHVPGTQHSDSCYVLMEELMKSQQGNYLQKFGIAEQFKPTTHYRNT